MPLSTPKLRNIKPSDKIQRLYDEKGLYLEVTPKGKTWWRFKYRFNDKEKRIVYLLIRKIESPMTQQVRNQS